MKASSLTLMMLASALIAGSVSPADAQEIRNIPAPSYLIQNPIAGHVPGKVASAFGGGDVLRTQRRPVDPFDTQHVLEYQGPEVSEYARVQVEEVSDSTWIPQEVEGYARFLYGRASAGSNVLEGRSVAGQNVIYLGYSRVGAYVWSSQNRAVLIEWARATPDAQGNIVPQELPQAFVEQYLARLPSDLPAIAFDDDSARAWVRREIDRHFSYLDGTLERATQAQNPENRQSFVSAVDRRTQLIVELRARYYGGPSPDAWSDEIVKRFQATYPGADLKGLQSEPEVRNRAAEMKQWWAAHRNDTPSLAPTPVPTP